MTEPPDDLSGGSNGIMHIEEGVQKQ